MKQNKNEGKRPDKIDFIFGIAMGFSFLISGFYSVHSETVKDLETLQVEYACYANEVDNFGGIDALKEHNLRMTTRAYSPSFNKKDISKMTKSELEKYIEELEYFSDIILDENNVIYKEIRDEITAAKEALLYGGYLYPYSEKDLNLLAYAVMKEQGDNRSSDECQSLVACVILNRVANHGINGTLENPTILGVLREAGQYPWGRKANYNVNTSNVTPKAFENARKALEHEISCPPNVLYQATFKQGDGVYKSFYNQGYGSTTYFCYGNLANQ